MTVADGVMRYGEKEIRVIEVVPGEQSGRKGWHAFDAWLVETGLAMQEAKMFYPADMFTFEPRTERASD